MEICYSDHGFKIESGNSAKEIVWTDITQVDVFKRDLITQDQIAIQILFSDKIIVLTEDDYSNFFEFTDKLENVFSTIPKDWYSNLVTRAFETNFRTIYIRP